MNAALSASNVAGREKSCLVVAVGCRIQQPQSFVPMRRGKRLALGKALGEGTEQVVTLIGFGMGDERAEGAGGALGERHGSHGSCDERDQVRGALGC